MAAPRACRRTSVSPPQFCAIPATTSRKPWPPAAVPTQDRSVASLSQRRMAWIILLAASGSVWSIDLQDLRGRPWWTVLVVTAMFVGAFVVVLVVEAVRARWQSRLRESGS